MKSLKVGAIALVSALAFLGAPAAAASQTCFGHKATIVGTNGDDHLIGTAARDIVVAGRGHDRVSARQGNDLVCGGPGFDELFLGRGADKANAGWGADFVAGARGNDSIWGGAGRDSIGGGAGRDTIWGGAGWDTIWGGAGWDTIWGGTGRDTIWGGAGRDTCRRGENVFKCEPIGFDWARAAWDDSHQGEPLDLTGYTKAFEDNFDSLSTITDGVTGSGPWYAPARPDTSVAHFLSPSQTPVTFSIDTPGVLTITMQKVNTSWYSGHIQTVNNIGNGFAQRYGYFEARMAFEKAVSWPAFWLYTPKTYEDSAQTRAEIDVVEAYGDNDYDGYHMAVHRRALQSHIYKSNYVGLSKIPAFAPGDMFDGSFHRYGCLVTPKWIVVYLDGLELSRFPTYPEAKLPLYMRVTLAMQDSFVASATSPTRLWVDYVRAYALP
jgi:hypothetical protein